MNFQVIKQMLLAKVAKIASTNIVRRITMADNVGIEETKEVLIALNELALVLIKLLKDGFQPSDDIKALVEKVSTDLEFQECLFTAYTDIQKVPSEIADLQTMEGLQLFWLEMRNLPRVIEALKGPKNG